MGWYAAAQKSDSHPPAQVDDDGEVSEAGEDGDGGAGVAGRVSEMPSMD